MKNQTLVLSDVDFAALKAACHNRSNWTDGGHWNGRGRAPNCSIVRTKSQVSSIRIHWLTEESAARWSRDVAATHRMLGYGVGLLASLVIALLPPARAVPANFRDFALSIALGEVGAGIAPEGVEKGDSLTVELHMHYQEPASPWMRRMFNVRTTTKWYDSRGTQRGEPAVSEQRFLANEFPFDLAWRLVNGPPANLDFAY